VIRYRARWVVPIASTPIADGVVAVEGDRIAFVGPADDVVALDDALARLAQKHPEKAELVKLRYFAGLTVNEAAEVLGVSTSTVDRNWSYARAWLFRELSREGEA